MLVTKVRLMASATFVSAMAVTSISHAQTAPVPNVAPPTATPVASSGIQDIVVTARRQLESLQKIPISITALDSVALDKINVQSVEKVAQIAPNLVISQQSSSLSSASINIRGIGQTDPSLGLDTAVGIYLDGVYVARSAGSIFDLVDLERIEVLRGPQGTLFGRNTTGGAIQLVSRRPADVFGMTVKAGYGTRNNWFGRVRVDTGNIGNLPISASFAYYHRQRDGYFNNTLTPSNEDPGALDVNAFTAALRGNFGALQVSYAFDYDHRTGTPGFFQTVALSDAAHAYYGNSASLGGAPLQFVGADTRLTSGQQQAGVGTRYTSKTVSQGHNLTASYGFSRAFTLKSITGYRRLDLDNVLGLSGQGDLKGLVLNPVTNAVTVQSVTPYNGYNPQNQKQFSQELQALGSFGDFNYVVGAYYFRENVAEDNHQMLTYIINAGSPQAPFYLGINLAPEAKYSQISKSAAGFGQISWKPSALDSRLEITGGARYTEDHKSIFLQNTSFGVSTVVGPPRGSAKFHNTSFLGSVSYQITDNALAYAKISTGYKSGGFNPRAATLNAFQPEKLISYEAGLKLDLLDRHLRVNSAVFYSKYSDLQVPQFAAGSGGASTLLVNAGKADFKGGELEITVLPMHGLTLSGSLGYTNPKYKQFLFVNPATNTVSDIANSARFPNLAKFNSNVAAEYAFNLANIGVFQARISYAYRSKIFFYPNDAVNPYQQQVSSPPTNTVDARLALTDVTLGSRTKAEIAINGENLLNENQVLYGIDFGSLGFGGKFYSEPRRVSVELKVTY